VSWALRLLPGLSVAYAAARRRGLMRVPLFRRAYARAYFSYKRRFEDPFDGLVRRCPQLFAGGHILDVGAQIGYTSSVFVRALTPGFKVFAFEPEAENFAFLTETIARRGTTGVVVPVHAAVGDQDGTIEFWTNPEHPGDHRVASAAFLGQRGGGLRTTSVRQVSLDGFLRSVEAERAPVAFVKIDVQGYEPAVCRGMTALLERCPDLAVAIELSPRELRAQAFAPSEVTSFFRSRGYSLQLLAKNGSLSPFVEEAADVESTGRGYADLLCSRRPLAG
jgi:FkbM family methyltransferase